MSVLDRLNESEKIILQQVAANPVFMKILKEQKEELQHQILNFWAQEKESDFDYRRRSELLHERYRYFNEQLNFYENLL